MTKDEKKERDKQWRVNPNYPYEMCHSRQSEYDKEKWKTVSKLDKLRKEILSDSECDVDVAVDVISHAARRIVIDTNYISSLRKVFVDFVSWADGQGKYDEVVSKFMSMAGNAVSREYVSYETMIPEYQKLKNLVSFMLDQYWKCKNSGVESGKLIEFLENYIQPVGEFVGIITYLERNAAKQSELLSEEPAKNLPMPRSKESIIMDMIKMKAEIASLKEKLRWYESKVSKDRIGHLEGVYSCSKNVVKTLSKYGAKDSRTIASIQNLLGQTKNVMEGSVSSETDKAKEN